MNFYDKITAENALEWYAELPAHLKKSIDNEKAKFKDGRECSSKEQFEVFDQVRKELGTRPAKPPEPTHPLDGYTHEQIAQFDKHKAWGKRYDELLLIKLILDNAEKIQLERKMLNAAMGINVNSGDLPSQAEGLDDTQAATVRWLQQSGEMPIEFLARTYRSEEAKMSDRLAAARVLMDYVHRKIPLVQKVEQELSVPKFDTKVLKGLTEKELNTLETLLKKMG